MTRVRRSCAAVALALASVLFTAAELNAPGTTGVLQASIGGKRTLVLADGPQIQDSHSMFFSALEVGDKLVLTQADIPSSCVYFRLLLLRSAGSCILLVRFEGIKSHAAHHFVSPPTYLPY